MSTRTGPWAWPTFPVSRLIPNRPSVPASGTSPPAHGSYKRKPTRKPDTGPRTAGSRAANARPRAAFSKRRGQSSSTRDGRQRRRRSSLSNIDRPDAARENRESSRLPSPFWPRSRPHPALSIAWRSFPLATKAPALPRSWPAFERPWVATYSS